MRSRLAPRMDGFAAHLPSFPLIHQPSASRTPTPHGAPGRPAGARTGPSPLAALLTALTLLATGCQPSSRSVVVDLDAVAKGTGRDAAIARAVENATQQLNTQLVQAARDMEEELKQLQAKAGANPTPQHQAEIQRARARAQQNVQNNKLVAEAARNRVRAEQILLFRAEVKPVAAQVAQARGADLVLIANEDVVWHQPALDITGEVITRLRTSAPSPASAPTSAPAPGPAAESGAGPTNAAPGTNAMPAGKP